MTRSAMHHWLTLAIASGIVFFAVGCPRTAVSPSRAYSVDPIPESGDEQPARTPPKNKLGGPYGNASKGKLTGEKTAGAPEMLNEKTNDAVLANYLDTLNFDMARDNGELAVVHCPDPTAPECHALLYIQPEIGMIGRKYRDIPKFGMVVARVINYSTKETDITYGIPPLTRAYWYVFPENGEIRSRVFIRTPGSAMTTLQFLEAKRMTYLRCPHPYAGSAAMAKFRRCKQDEREMTRSGAGNGEGSNPFVRPVSFRSAPPLPAAGDDAAVALTSTELWVKCAEGCCYAGP